MASVAKAQTAGPDIDARWNKSWPAGPYTEVSTAFGGSDTHIPLFSLAGRGNTSISFGIRNRSNQSTTAPWGIAPYKVGRGWVTDYDGSVQIKGSENEVQQSLAGNTIGRWSYTINGNTGAYIMTRRPGVRADIQQLQSGTRTTGFIITD